jgi:hypothetical protein
VTRTHILRGGGSGPKAVEVANVPRVLVHLEVVVQVEVQRVERVHLKVCNTGVDTHGDRDRDGTAADTARRVDNARTRTSAFSSSFLPLT